MREGDCQGTTKEKNIEVRELTQFTSHIELSALDQYPDELLELVQPLILKIGLTVVPQVNSSGEW